MLDVTEYASNILLINYFSIILVIFKFIVFDPSNYSALLLH